MKAKKKKSLIGWTTENWQPRYNLNGCGGNIVMCDLIYKNKQIDSKKKVRVTIEVL
ncbi:MAG: hypothetical protein JRJ39_00170 [Deltaproteobacteria bacterium]|nr:hypothetical protein [Deltaproteobacteria bacterium]